VGVDARNEHARRGRREASLAELRVADDGTRRPVAPEGGGGAAPVATELLVLAACHRLPGCAPARTHRPVGRHRTVECGAEDVMREIEAGTTGNVGHDIDPGRAE